jgi:hypothetical protein
MSAYADASNEISRSMRLLGGMVLACVVATASIACGDEPDVEEQVGAALAEIRDDFDAGRIASACARMSVGAGCREKLRLLRERAQPSTSSLRSGRREVVDVRSKGGRATAVVTLNKRVDGRLRFARRGGEWRLADIGVRADPKRSRWKPATGQLRDFSLPKMRLAACSQMRRILHHGRHPVRGGCVLRFSSDDMAIVMLSAFGDFTVARCSMRFDFHAASNTLGTLADDIDFRGPGICARARPCADGETGLRYPWQGDGLTGSFSDGVHLRFDICINTPLGRARGMLHYRLVERDGELTARTYDYPIGESSIQLVGAWQVEPDELRSPSRGPSASSR